jgi:hypothetical protein
VEEFLYLVRELLEQFHVGADSFMKLAFIPMREKTNVMILQIAPYMFVLVQFWRIRRKVEKSQHTLGLLHKLQNLLRAVHRVIINN